MKPEKPRILPSRPAGFGLVELMIAMVLGLIVLGAAVAVFQSNQRTYSANEGQNRVQENARAAYEMMVRDIRATGGSACSSEARVLGSDANSVLFRTALSGTPTEFTTTSADDLSYRVKPGTASTNSVTLLEPTPAASDIFKPGDVVMVCNAALTGFTTVAATSGQTVTFTTPLPFDPQDTTNADPGSVSISRLRSNRWFVQPNGRESGSSLWVSSFGGAAQEVADGVQGLRVTYRQSANGNPTAYVTNPSNFQYVDAIRVVMPMRAVMPSQIPGEVRNVDRTVATGASLRNRLP
ncbi:PilW family protein [Thermomonas flagellata]|uniref:PilW family protein n=1 Tax=Thermomonas flagellata TaxID=2888524 RepID=UPI001F0337E7